MDGWVKIGTRLDSAQLDKDLKQMGKDLKSAEKDEVKIKASIDKTERDLQPYQEELELIKELTNESLQYAQSSGEVENALSIEQSMVESLNGKYSKQLEIYNSLSGELSENTQKQKELKTSISETKAEVDKLKGINSVLSSAKKQTGSVISKVAKWGLAIFGVRSAYMGIRRVISMVRSENEEIDAGFKAIENFFATAFEPVVKRLLSWVMTLVQYVNYLAKAWFGVDILAKSNEKSLKGANKQAKELSKSLTGFDEMNVINDSGGTGVAGGGVGELPTPEDVEVPTWLKWIAENKDIVIGALLGIATGLVMISAGINLIKATGIGLIVAGLYILVKGILDFIKDPSWDSFANILLGISLILAGIGILMGSWILLLIALGIAIVSAVIKNWDKVKEILSVVGSWIYDKVIKPVGDFFKGLWENIKNIFSSVGDFFKNIFTGAWNGIKSAFSAVGSFFSNVFNTIKNIFKNIGQTIGNVVSSAFKTAINAVLSIADGIINTPIKAINKLIGTINKVPGINLGTLSTVKIPRLKTGGIINYPNRGVSVGGGRAIGGESGAEGVIPLTDSQAMETLGEAIGKYISLNISNEVKMDGKVISREVKKINQNNDFVMNR